MDSVKFKKSGDLITFAAEHPGAIGAYFLGMVHQRVTRGPLTRTKDLRRVSVSTWAAAHSGLTEKRDLRELATLAAAIDALQQGDLSRLIDVLASRINALQIAKGPQGSWEKAEKVELIGASGSRLMPSGMAAWVSS